VNRYLAETESLSFDQLRERGIFEFMLGPKPSHDGSNALVRSTLHQTGQTDVQQVRRDAEGHVNAERLRGGRAASRTEAH
jgi:hypothetical protein